MTPDEQRSLEALQAACGTEDGPIERHSRRVFLLAEELAGGRELDRELLACACWLHEIGLYPSVATKAAYVTDGRRVAEELLAHWPAERLLRCGDAIELHHAPRSQEARGLEVELVRLADRIELSQGLLREGLPRDVVRRIRSEVPVRGFVPEILRLLGRHFVRRPFSMPRILFPPRP